MFLSPGPNPCLCLHSSGSTGDPKPMSRSESASGSTGDPKPSSKSTSMSSLGSKGDPEPLTLGLSICIDYVLFYASCHRVYLFVLILCLSEYPANAIEFIHARDYLCAMSFE